MNKIVQENHFTTTNMKLKCKPHDNLIPHVSGVFLKRKTLCVQTSVLAKEMLMETQNWERSNGLILTERGCAYSAQAALPPKRTGSPAGPSLLLVLLQMQVLGSYWDDAASLHTSSGFPDLE